MLFEQVFDAIELEPRLQHVVRDCEVLRITSSQSLPVIIVYLSADHMLAPTSLRMLEQELKRQYFFDSGRSVKISMSYSFPEDTPLSELWKQLSPHLLEQRMLDHHLDAEILEHASIEVEENVLYLSVEDAGIARAREKELCAFVQQYIAEWTGRTCLVKFRYIEPKERGAQAEERIYSIDELLANNQRRRRAREQANAVPRDLQKPKEKEPAPAPKRPASSGDKFRRAPISADPDIFYGKAFDASSIVPISEIRDEIGDVVIRGKIIKYEERSIREDKLVITFAVTDFTDTINVKLFMAQEKLVELGGKLKEGAFVMLKGTAMYDKYDHEVVVGSLFGIKTITDFTIKRRDTSEAKRVELHCHTQMSDMDAVVNTKELVKTAFEWGHPAVAITDHGVVQSFVDASHALNGKDYANDPEKYERFKKFKIIYGMEGYIVDDEVATNADGEPLDLERDKEEIKKLKSHHIILLCKNDIGRINLYRLTSFSHIDYFYRTPRIPKSLLRKYREGLIVGSACEAGELFQAIANNAPQEELERISAFYDYYEVQPIGNNAFMKESEHFPEVTTDQDLIRLNKQIIRLAEEHGKLCVATGDVHFMNPEDEIYRRIIMAGKGFADADRQPPLYFRTTDEMLDEFRYLPKEKAFELVVTNPNKICDMVEPIQPVRPDKCPPVIENSDKDLRDLCYETAHSMYGEQLPKQVEDRLEKELKSIITNGFAVMYIIAQRLVKHSNDDGYLVGSRGSVGSSFVATMSGITEVNPLPAHYYCLNCHYNDFDSEEVKSYSQMSGYDMPDKLCPVCGKPLKKDGQNIPFETFLGFNGDKEPDIDLNFSGEYQSNAHAYTEVLFGKGHTFRAGTISTLADKTAFGYIMKYYEERGLHKRAAEVDRIVKGCVGVRRTTGQHPGGIIVLPHGEEIYSFTAVHRPANDMNSTSVTTHFDYHSIDHNLLKLDILGHDDPTMIRMLEDLTGLNARDIPMDDPKVVSLFSSTEALGIRPEDIDGCDLGSLGLPELGTDFVMQMLRDTKPKSFSDMIRISGLSHGTDVWLNNTQTLIQEGKCTLSTAICTRDDIMVYLIHMGVESGKAFKIMESVRKGKGLTEDMEESMKACNVPDWYIWSCKRIKYMFPKAHACAYIMMAFRIGYCKVHYPLAYYAAYFSIRAKSFSYELMALGKERLNQYISDFKHRSNSLSNKEQEQLKDMKIVQEMYARGFEFLPIDLYRVKATRFQILDGKLMPSLISIDGLGENAAAQIEEGMKEGPLLSRDDFRLRCHVGQSTVELLNDLGLFGSLPESNQLSFTDMGLL